MKVIITLLLISFILTGCSHQENYTEILKEWQAQQDNSQIAALQKQLKEANTQIDNLKTKYAQDEADNKNLQSQMDILKNQNQELQNELSKRPEQSDITAILDANQEAVKQYNEIATKYNALLPMWQQFKRDYIELASALKEVVASSNISANVTQEYLNLIKPVE